MVEPKTAAWVRRTFVSVESGPRSISWSLPAPAGMRVADWVGVGAVPLFGVLLEVVSLEYGNDGASWDRVT